MSTELTTTPSQVVVEQTNHNTSINGDADYQRRKQKGCLVVTILSVYDLPRRDPPESVTLTACGQQQVSGPPSARHKDKNSFKFTDRNVLELVAPLEVLYNTHATLTLQYQNPNNSNTNQQSQASKLQATIQLSSLKIHESNWLILNLESPKSATTTNGNATNSTTTTPLNPPTIRLQVQLMGPYRREIAFCVHLLQAWFGFIDPLESQVAQTLAPVVAPVTSFRLSSIPVLPIVALVLMTSPVWIWSMPILLPLLLVAGTGGAVVLLGVLVVYLSSSDGRDQISGLFTPLVNTLLSTKSGQRLVYETGPRPTPVKICRAILPTDHLWYMLALSLVIDAIGSSSYLLPVLGEGFDLTWAPIQTMLIMAMYENERRSITNGFGSSNTSQTLEKTFPSWPGLKYLSFFEELLPFTDIIPSATIGWWIKFGPTLWKEHVANGPLQHLDFKLLLGNEDKNHQKATTTTTTTSSSDKKTTTSPLQVITPFNTPLSSANY